MGYCFIISRREGFICELKKYLREETYVEPVGICLKPLEYSDKSTVFNVISDKIRTYSSERLRQSRVIVDEVISKENLDPLLTASNGESIWSMLTLAFPELSFTFLNHSDLDGLLGDNAHFNFWLDNFGNVKSQSPLFDPNGLRNAIRKNINNTREQTKIHQLKERSDRALSIEDEKEYAFFHAYTAYKLGYRCSLITSEKQLNDLKESSPKIGLQFEDIYLNFPDRKKEDLSDLKQRDQEYFSFLKEVKNRIFTTVGHSHTKHSRSNKGYKKWLKLIGKKVETLYKPSSGIYDILRKSKLFDAYTEIKKWEYKRMKTPEISDTSKRSHSTPGVLLLIAEKMLSRAQKILAKAQSVPEAIHSALLAMDAKELLGGRTPTIAIKAVALQHEAEVTAENMFFGVEYARNVDDRIKDIEEEITAIAHWFNKNTRKRQKINAQLHIVEILAKKFNEFNQFEEEMRCLAEARKLRFAFWREQNFLRKAVKPLHKYIEIGMSSIPKFLAIVFFWILFFGVVYFWIGNINDNKGIWDSLTASARFFFSLELSGDWGDIFKSLNFWNYKFWGNLILSIQGVISFFNLSLLLSHLYLLISRR